MKILVTGGSGLVGKAIQSLVENDENDYLFLNSKMCDLTDYSKTLQVFEDFCPDQVIHLAAYVGGLYKNMNYKAEMFENNMLINMNVLKASHTCNCQKVICCLSTCIFPDKTSYPIDETMLHNGPPHYSNDAYAYAKRMLEIQCKIYREQHGKNFVCVIPTNIYGEHDNFSLEDGHVIPSLIYKCYLCKQQNEPFVVRGTGNPLRQFIYSLDLAKLILIVLKDYKYNESIILSVSEKDEVSIKEVATIIANKYNYVEHMVFDESYSDGQYKKTADNTKLLTFLRNEDIDFQFTNIREGIEKTIEWFIWNYNEARK